AVDRSTALQVTMQQRRTSANIPDWDSRRRPGIDINIIDHSPRSIQLNAIVLPIVLARFLRGFPMTNATATQSSRSSFPWLIVACGCIIAAMTFGPRSAMGFFQLPMLEDRGWDRTTFGLAMALQNLLWGAGQPIFGAIADRFGTWRVLALSGILYAAGLCMMAVATDEIMLHIGGGVLVGLGVAAGSFGIVLAAFARRIAPE